MASGELHRRHYHESRSPLPRRVAGLNVVAILGHTASGKSSIAEAAASHFGATIVSVDSMQVFRGMDIGTAKPSVNTRAEIPHRMVDVADPEDEFDVTLFQAMARTALDTIEAEGGRALIVGGSGLHYRVIVDPYTFAPTDGEIRDEIGTAPLGQLVKRLLDADADAGNHVDLENSRRVVRAIEVLELTGLTPSERAASEEHRMVAAYEPLIEHLAFGVDAGGLAHRRAEDRFSSMIRSGLVDEVRSLRQSLGPVASQAVGYKELVPFVDGSIEIAEAIDTANQATRALIKRQRTFFGRDPRIGWLPWQDDEDKRIVSAIDAIEGATQWTS